MSLQRAGAVARRILQQFRHDRRTLVLLFVAPILILGLFYFLLRGGSTLPVVDVVNLDAAPGQLGTSLSAALQSAPGITARESTPVAAQRDLTSGAVAAVILLPPDFTTRFRQGTIAPQIRLEGSQPAQSQAVLATVSAAMQRAANLAAPTRGFDLPRAQPVVTYLHGGSELDTLDYFGAAFIGLVVFFLVFVVTIIAFLRERSQGTLERLMASPLRRSEIVSGYIGGFMAVAALQAVEVALFTLYALHVHNQGNIGLIVLMTLLMSLVAVNLGVFLSMFSTTEFQAVQFIPLAIVPQVLLSGIIFPVSSEPGWLQGISRVLPLTYGVDGLHRVMLEGASLSSGTLLLDLGVVAAFAVALVAAATATLRRSLA